MGEFYLISALAYIDERVDYIPMQLAELQLPVQIPEILAAVGNDRNNVIM